MATVTMKELLEAGVHFGHQVRRWNPKMKEYIFGERNGIYIIDLQKTQKLFRDALAYVTEAVSERPNMKILFVGTKRQAQDAIREEAERCGQYYVNNRWLGGLLTNFQTVQNSIQKLKNIEAMREDGRYDMLTKKERLQLDRTHESLMKNLAGIKDMKGLPDMLFIIDVRKEEIAVAGGDFEIALRRCLDRADGRAAVLGKLFGRGAGVLRRLRHHRWLDPVQLREGIGHARAFPARKTRKPARAGGLPAPSCRS